MTQEVTYEHPLEGGYKLVVNRLRDDLFVVICEDTTGRVGERALVETCQRCAWAACFRLERSGKWKELAPEEGED